MKKIIDIDKIPQGADRVRVYYSEHNREFEIIQTLGKGATSQVQLTPEQMVQIIEKIFTDEYIKFGLFPFRLVWNGEKKIMKGESE